MSNSKRWGSSFTLFGNDFSGKPKTQAQTISASMAWLNGAINDGDPTTKKLPWLFPMGPTPTIPMIGSSVATPPTIPSFIENVLKTAPTYSEHHTNMQSNFNSHDSYTIVIKPGDDKQAFQRKISRLPHTIHWTDETGENEKLEPPSFSIKQIQSCVSLSIKVKKMNDAYIEAYNTAYLKLIENNGIGQPLDGGDDDSGGSSSSSSSSSASDPPPTYDSSPSSSPSKSGSIMSGGPSSGSGSKPKTKEKSNADTDKDEGKDEEKYGSSGPLDDLNPSDLTGGKKKSNNPIISGSLPITRRPKRPQVYPVQEFVTTFRMIAPLMTHETTVAEDNQDISHRTSLSDAELAVTFYTEGGPTRLINFWCFDAKSMVAGTRLYFNYVYLYEYYKNRKVVRDDPFFPGRFYLIPFCTPNDYGMDDTDLITPPRIVLLHTKDANGNETAKIVPKNMNQVTGKRFYVGTVHGYFHDTKNATKVITKERMIHEILNRPTLTSPEDSDEILRLVLTLPSIQADIRTGWAKRD